ncbi:O-antigen polymerase [Halorussus marinus]|uniref:O-antigen polymerase n=1 Tax=Halorussus marinus TaxID=2505976 RepID=UPI00143D7931|nr:O-antigen polymerase [Halorussus marinus]
MEGKYRNVSVALVAVVVGTLSGLLSFFFGLQSVLIALLFLVCAIPTVVSLIRGTFDIFEPIVFYSIFMFMTTVAIFDRVYLQDPYFRYPKWVSWEFSTAFFIVSVLYVLFYGMLLIGYYFKIERWITVPTFFSDSGDHDGTMFRRAGLLYMVFGTLSYILLVASALDWNLLYLYTTMEPRSNVFDGATHFKLGARSMYIGYLVWITGTLIDGNRTGIAHLLPLIPISGFFFLLGGRGQVILIILISVIMMYYVHIYPVLETKSGHIHFTADRLHRRVKQLSLPVLGVLIGIGTVVSGGLRSGGDLTGSFDTARLIEILTFGIHNSHLDNLLVTVSIVPEQIGYFWGTFVFRVPLNYIPRSVWPDKPVLTVGSLIRRIFRPDANGGRPPGMIGRLYVDGGLVAIIVGALLFGFTLRLLYQTLVKNRHSPVFLLVYSVCLASVASGELGNNALWLISNHLLLLSPIIFIYYRNKNER